MRARSGPFDFAVGADQDEFGDAFDVIILGDGSIGID